jgi:membrane-bound serine protease (ClpP class)
VIFLIGFVIAIFVVPDEWTVPVIVVAAVLEISETAITWWWSRRAAPKVGPETLIGSMGRVVEACRPHGTVRVNGEIWRARCDAGADADEIVRVVDREKLTLLVEPAAEVPPAS